MSQRSSSERPDSDRVGQVLGDRWRIVRLLGRGGMATVYEARHRDGARVAIKLLSAELSHRERTRRRFLREARVANAVGHPGAVRILDQDTTADGRPFLVMEMLDGETLRSRCLSAGGRLDLAQVLGVIDHVLDVLAMAHARGIVHRDIKPANIFLTTGGGVKVLDFGIASFSEERESNAGPTTQTGFALGTPAFMAPEQARGWHAKVDARSDLWAVGASAFYALTGRHVHGDAATPNEALIFAATQPAPPLGQFRPDLPVEVARLVDRALAIEPAKRWPSAEAMRAPIALLLGDAEAAPGSTAAEETAEATAVSSESAPMPPPRAQRRIPRRRLAFVAAVASALPLAAAASWVALRSSSPIFAGSWACLDAPPVPSDPSQTVDVEFIAFDAFRSFTLGSAVDGGNAFTLLDYAPLVGTTIKACASLDPMCIRPTNAEAVTDDAGVAHLRMSGGFNGVYSMRRPDAFPAVYYPGRLLAGEPHVTYPVSALDYQVGATLGRVLGALPNAESASGVGQLYVTVYDCEDRQVAGIAVEMTNVKTGVSFYLQNGFPNFAAHQTDPQGTAGFVNVREGNVSVLATRLRDGRPIGTMNVYVQSGGVTYVDMRPRVR